MQLSLSTSALTSARDDLNRATDTAKLAREAFLSHVISLNRVPWGCPRHDELLLALGRADRERARAGLLLNRLYRPT